MSYFFMSNIQDFDDINNSDKSYAEVNVGEIINFTDTNNINKKASFFMARAHADNDILIQLLPYGYGVLIPATELWSVDSLMDLEGFIIKKIFNPQNGSELQSSTAKIQWMIGYK